jgi:subtilisin-like proprotein convertase family protein
MRSRILSIVLIMMLALPMTAVRPPVQASTHLQEQAARTLAAKKHGKKKKPKFRTVRRPVTQTFSSAGAITIPAGAPGTTFGNADPYPTTITVAGFANGRITDVNLTLHGLSHSHRDDLDVLLAATHLPAQNAIVMSEAGGSIDAADLTLTLDDQAATPLPDAGPPVSGTFQPANYGELIDTFPAPAPVPGGNSLLAVFNNGNPNGIWQLFVVDENPPDVGGLAGWSLQITADVDVQVKKHKKKHRKGKR